ncbi:hypothetical protein BJX61DRAFT_356375 [Aspergillus egyptiacus]|nr:hypothetical protein BJX61DRAFT_356375 [Aspergillus egyptiacus]
MEPFSASQEDHRSGMRVPNIDEPSSVFTADLADRDPIYRPHSYRDTERALLKYVSDEISQGRVPSDRQLQMKMSEIMYGPDNMWDPTWADNPQWLEMFRRKAGLINLPTSPGKNAFVGFDAATLYDR